MDYKEFPSRGKYSPHGGKIPLSRATHLALNKEKAPFPPLSLSVGAHHIMLAVV